MALHMDFYKRCRTTTLSLLTLESARLQHTLWASPLHLFVFIFLPFFPPSFLFIMSSALSTLDDQLNRSIHIISDIGDRAAAGPPEAEGRLAQSEAARE